MKKTKEIKNIKNRQQKNTKKKKVSALFVYKKNKAGRSYGKISIRHRGGGHKRKYRLIDFKQEKIGVPGKVISIEYDPNRSANIAQVNYLDGDKRYIIAPVGLQVGHDILSGPKAPILPGNRVPLKNIPIGMSIYNIEINRHSGAQLVRSAGNSAKLLAKEEKYVNILLPSGEIRKINSDYYATIGSVSNQDQINIKLRKAGQTRWRGFRPTVRGKAMDPSSHPHGGGEGRNPIGLIHAKTPWGKVALGKKTRNRHKYSNKFIVRSRKRK